MRTRFIVFVMLITFFTTLYSVQPIASAAISVSADFQLSKSISVELNIGVGESDVVALRTDNNFEYADIVLAYACAAESHRDAKDIISMRYDQKMGWGQIAHALGLKVPEVKSKAAKMLDKANLSNESTKLSGKLR
jgi:hypothetical protein